MAGDSEDDGRESPRLESNPPDPRHELEVARSMNKILKEELQLLRNEVQFYTAQLREAQSFNTNASNLTSNNNADARKNVKLPAFNAEKPRLWFSQVESVFSVNNITAENVKYSLVSSQLTNLIANEVEDILISPPTDKPYEKLKTELISRLSKSEDHRVRQLLRVEELSDSTASQFLRRLKALAGATKVDEQLLRTLWLQRLPSEAQKILQTHSTDTSLDKLAEIADRILEVVPAKTVCAITTAPSQSPNLEKLLESISERLSRLESSARQNANQNRSRSRSRSQKRFPDGYCFYHHKFGENATKCRPPCSYSKATAKDSTNSNGSQ